MNHNIGDIIVLKQDFEAKRALTGTPLTLRKGTEGIILADQDHPSVLFHNGCYISLPTGDTVSSELNLRGITTWILYKLENKFDICEKLEEFEGAGNEAEVYLALHDCIVDALRDIGFKENRGDKSEN